MSRITFDIEVAFYPEITRMAIERGVDEKKFSWHIDAAMRYVTHISYKIDDKKVVDLSLMDFTKNLVGDAGEKQLLEAFSKVYNQCDESVAHYGSKFDIRFLNSRISRAGLPPLKPVKLRDTWRILKDKFALPNNRLDTAISFFNCPYGKPSLQWSLWREVSLGNLKAHKTLRNRCHYDTLSLAWIYDTKLHVYDSGSVNKALAYNRQKIDDAAVTEQLKTQRCPDCRNVGTLVRRGYSYSKAATKFQLSCRSCFGWAGAPIKTDGSMGQVR